MTNDLTPREREVAELITQGMQAKGIAQQLGISPETVRRHTTHIMDKSGMSNRTELAVWWLTQRNRLDPAPLDVERLNRLVARYSQLLQEITQELD